MPLNPPTNIEEAIIYLSQSILLARKRKLSLLLMVLIGAVSGNLSKAYRNRETPIIVKHIKFADHEKFCVRYPPINGPTAGAMASDMLTTENILFRSVPKNNHA